MKFFRPFLTILFVFTLLVTSFTVALAAPVVQEAPGLDAILDKILSLIGQFFGLAGVAGLLILLTNVLKYYGVIPDGYADRVASLLNLLAFAVLVGFQLFAPQYSLDFLDATAAKFASIGTFIVGLLFQLGSGQTVYNILSKTNIPILGYSRTRDALRQFSAPTEFVESEAQG